MGLFRRHRSTGLSDTYLEAVGEVNKRLNREERGRVREDQKMSKFRREARERELGQIRKGLARTNRLFLRKKLCDQCPGAGLIGFVAGIIVTNAIYMAFRYWG